MDWKRIKSETGPNLKIFQVRYDYMRNPRNGKVEKMVVLETEDSANVVATTKEGKVLMVRQYRFGIGKETLELPGGFMEPGEDSKVGTQRELVEETGFTGGEWEYLGAVPSNPVFMDSYIHHWLAVGVSKTTDVQLDDGEHVEVEEMTVAELRQAVLDGQVGHPHTVSALVRVFNLWEPKFSKP